MYVFVIVVLFIISVIYIALLFMCVFFVKLKTAYEMRISDWSSDVCSSDLAAVYHSRSSCRATLCGYASLIPSCGTTSSIFASSTKPAAARWQIGRAWCRERVCQYV